MYGTISPYYLKEILPVKYIKQFLIILLFTFLGEALAYLLPFPIPAAIYGLVLLFTALCIGLLKPEHIDQTARFLLQIMSVLFVAPTVNILASWGLIAPKLLPIAAIVTVSTVVVFAVSGLVARAFMKKGGEDHD
jgi:holin-like protein